TWDGGGADANLNTAANWVGDVNPLTTDDVVFTGLTRTTPVVNAALHYKSITVDLVASAFTAGGATALVTGPPPSTAGNLTNRTLFMTADSPARTGKSTVSGGALRIPRSNGWGSGGGTITVLGPAGSTRLGTLEWTGGSPLAKAVNKGARQSTTQSQLHIRNI